MTVLWTKLKMVMYKKEDRTIDNLLDNGATNNLLRKPNSLSNIRGRPEFNAPLNAVNTINPAPKKLP